MSFGLCLTGEQGLFVCYCNLVSIVSEYLVWLPNFLVPPLHSTFYITMFIILICVSYITCDKINYIIYYYLSGTWLSGGLGSPGLTVVIDDLKGLFHPKEFYDSTILTCRLYILTIVTNFFVNCFICTWICFIFIWIMFNIWILKFWKTFLKKKKSHCSEDTSAL